MNKINVVLPLLIVTIFSFSVEVIYEGKTLNIEVSNKDFSVLIFPDRVERVITTKGNAKAKAKGNEVLVSVSDEAALWVRLVDGRTYFFYLIPSPRPPEQFRVIDVRKKEKEIPEIEKKTPHEELMANLIKAILRNQTPPGYEKTVKVYAIDTPKLLIVTEGFWDGYFYRIWKAKLINKTDEVIRIREDMKFFEKLIRKEWGRPYALAITTEYLKPDEYALMVAVVGKRSQENEIPISKYDEMIKNFLFQK